MAIKKKLLILLIGALSICLFFAFGFQIDVGGGINEDGGTADVSLIGPLRIAADEANAALVAAEQAVLDLAAAEQAVLDAQEALAAAGTPEEIAAAEQAVLDAQAALAAAVTPEEITAAEQAVLDAQAALAAAGTPEEITAAEQALLDALTALAAAVTPEEIAAAEQALLEAQAAAQQAADEANAVLGVINEGTKYSHIITNSNNGGSFTGDNSEGNYSSVDGDTLPFTFESEDGFELVWLRVGNIKIPATDSTVLVLYSEIFNKKNLTIHAHFKKDKDSETTTVEGTSLDEDVLLGDENSNGNGNGKGKDKEKSNNGKNNKNK